MEDENNKDISEVGDNINNENVDKNEEKGDVENDVNNENVDTNEEKGEVEIVTENKEEFGVSKGEIEKEGILRSQNIEITNNDSKNPTKVERIKSNISRTSTRASLPPPGFFYFIFIIYEYF